MNLREHVLQEALTLTAEDRAFVVDHLEQSLPHGDFVSAEIAASWTAEIDRRISAYDRGEIKSTDFDTAIARIRTYLADHRARKSQT